MHSKKRSQMVTVTITEQSQLTYWILQGPVIEVLPSATLEKTDKLIKTKIFHLIFIQLHKKTYHFLKVHCFVLELEMSPQDLHKKHYVLE